MALVKGNIPLTHKASRKHWFQYQHDHNHRTVVAKFTHRKEKPKRAKPIPPFGNKPAPAAAYNRALLATLSSAWAQVLYTDQQLAWIALADANPVMTYDGEIKTLNGKQFYDWWCAVQYFWNGAVASIDAVKYQFIWTDPPEIWDPPITPYNLGISYIDDERIRVDFYTTPDLDPWTGWALISIPPGLSRQTNAQKFVRCSIGINAVAPSLGLYNFDVYIQPTWPNSLKISGAKIRIRIMSDLDNLVPSHWAEIEVP